MAVYDSLDRLAPSALTEEAKGRLWQVLDRCVRRHRQFQDAQWALPVEELAIIHAVAARFAPKDPVEVERWLFDEGRPFLTSEKRFDFEKVEFARDEAVARIWQAQGLDGILRLCRAVAHPAFVGASAGRRLSLAALDRLLDAALPEGGLHPVATMASVVARDLHAARWAEHLANRSRSGGWSPAWVGLLVSLWPDNSATWDFVDSLGQSVSAEYWRTKPCHVLLGDQESRALVIDRYIGAGRALDALAAFGEEDIRLPAPVVFRVLDAAMNELRVEAAQRRAEDVGYWVGQIFESLGERSDVDETEVARREYAWLPALQDQGGPRVLDRILARDAALFVEVLADVFRAEDADPEMEPTVAQETRATYGYYLLTNWTLLPGASEQGIDEGVLHAWVERARSLAREQRRLGVCERQIGRLLAHAPSDADGVWPTRAVRAVIEAVASADLERGVSLERFNMRGVVSKGVFEGGKQERELAKQTSDWAEHVAAWPRTQRLLRRMAKKWVDYADSEDVRASQDRLRYP